MIDFTERRMIDDWFKWNFKKIEYPIMVDMFLIFLQDNFKKKSMSTNQLDLFVNRARYFWNNLTNQIKKKTLV